MVECLKKIPVKSLILAMKSLLVFLDFVPYTIFGPVVEKGGKNPFISEQPYKLLKEGKVYDVPWVVSNTKHEGLFPAGCKLIGLGQKCRFKFFIRILAFYLFHLKMTVDWKLQFYNTRLISNISSL